MNLYRNIIICLLLLLLAGGGRSAAVAQEAKAKLCSSHPTSANTHAISDTGGIYMTSEGTVRALIVFASFPDDTMSHPFWPAHQPPQFMQQFIDPDTFTRSSSQFNLTNYFRQMSMGKLNLVGRAIWIESTHSQEEYREGAYGRANKHLLQEQADPLVDFTQYDHWTKVADYNHLNVPDGLVDMIIMVWRTNMFEYVGEASLGYWPGFTVDGIRIENGYPAYIPMPRGSGITCQYLYGDTHYKLTQTMVHELGHWLLGKPHPYNNDELSGKHAYWGMLCSNQRVASCVNAYERERLGWIIVPEISPDQDLVLTDYLTTGCAFKYHPANGEPFEYYYIENHQLLSLFDDITANPEDKGLWIQHQQGPYMEEDNFRIRPSDGNWKWENPRTTTSCFSQSLPVFKKGVPRTRTGESHRDQIQNQASAVNWLHAYQDPAGQLNCGQFYTGQMFTGAFSADSFAIFSRFSNPAGNTWDNQQTSFSLEVIDGGNGSVTVRYHSQPLDAAPARRYLGADPTVSGTLPGSVSLAWGAQWMEGQLLESDVEWSELQRRISSGGNWITVYQGSTTSWSDTSISYDTSGTIPVLFRARVRDTQGKYSGWSNVFYTAMNPATGVRNLTGEVGGTPVRYELGANYPNPFNPSTTITFTLPKQSHVRLSICDVLGREVQQLIDAPFAPGTHAITWDGTASTGAKVASGVYIYRLQASTKSRHAGSFVSSRAMVLLK